MNFAQYISELLVENDCVIIPGLGGFVANYQSAVVSGNAHVSFMPPSKQLLFNIKLNQNDGLLVTKILLNQNITYKQAEEQVLDFVYGIKKELHQTGAFSLEGIGLLLLNKTGAIEFQPIVDTNLFAESFGLSTFVYPQLHYGIRAKHRVTFKQAVPKRSATVLKTIKQVAVVIPMLLLLAVLPTVYLKNSQQSSFSFFNTSENENIKTVRSIAVPVRNIKQKDKLVAKSCVDYHIIIGCFKNIQTANKLCETFKTKGFRTSVLNINDMYKVSLQSFNDLREANKVLITFQEANPEFSDSWILSK